MPDLLALPALILAIQQSCVTKAVGNGTSLEIRKRSNKFICGLVSLQRTSKLQWIKMRLVFVFSFIVSITTLVVSVHGALRGESILKYTRALKSNKDDELTDAVEEPDRNQCRDMPVQIRDDGSQTNFATLYAGIYASGETATINNQSLCDSLIASYTYLTDCSVIPGSYRQVAECSVVDDASGPNEDAFLLKLTYFSNAVNGAMLFEFERPDPSCTCNRCPGLEPFPGIYRLDENGPTCTCYCDILSENLSNTACTCRSPLISDLIDVMNIAYEDEDFFFLDARQLTIDSGCSNTGTTSTFNDTFICPGQESSSLL
jgi:hypothetical protein